MEKPLEDNFEIKKSPIHEAYILLNASSPLELHMKYTEEDQRLMKEHAWDYKNADLVTNKVKEILENIDPLMITNDERDWRQEILWFW